MLGAWLQWIHWRCGARLILQFDHAEPIDLRYTSLTSFLFPLQTLFRVSSGFRKHQAAPLRQSCTGTV
jgi:hypothetical protein